MHLIRGTVKDYAWGIVDGLAPWTSAPTGGPEAELWFGVHPSGPSTVIAEGTEDGTSLGDHLTREQAPILGKVLAAAQPLSVQVHPNARDAQRMWDEQHIAGPQILADPYEKTEVLLALEPFDAFVGWRPFGDAAEIIERIDGLHLAAAALHAHDTKTAIQMIVERKSDAGDLARQLPGAVRGAQEAGRLRRPLTANEVAAFERAARDYPDDIGVTLTPLLDFVTLAPGEAVYLAPGIPHSYVRGIGFEVMTSSDNVLRLGLTGKPIYIDQALTIMDYTTPAQFLSGSSTIAPQGAPFELQVVAGDEVEAASGAYRLVVAIEGACSVTVGQASLEAAQGQGVAIAAHEPAARISAPGMAIVAQAS